MILACANDETSTASTSSSQITGWARSTVSGSAKSQFNSVAVDSNGNIFAAGIQTGTSAYSYAAGVSASCGHTGENSLLVKYNSGGSAQWAKCVTGGGGDSQFKSVATDSAGNIYAVGLQTGNSAFNYGNSITLSGGSADNAVLVKFNTNGDAQFARRANGANNASQFDGIVIDSSDNIFVAGNQTGNGSFDYGNSQTASGSASGNSNPVLVKYNSSGDAQWVKTRESGNSQATFVDVVSDSSGNLYVVGQQNATVSGGYGNSVTTTGSAPVNLLLVKYNSAGTAQWARSSTAGTDNSFFVTVAVDSTGDVYVSGLQLGTGTMTYASGITTTALSNDGTSVLLKYNSVGTAQWARTPSTGSAASAFGSLAVTSNNLIGVVGNQTGTTAYNYGDGFSLSAVNSGTNAVYLQYNVSGTVQLARTVAVASGATSFSSLVFNSSNHALIGGTQTGNASVTWAGEIKSTGSASGVENAALLRFEN